MNILLTGGSGMIGKRLSGYMIENGHQVAWLSHSDVHEEQIHIFKWDIEKAIIDEEAIKWAEVIVHLAGENIADRKWTKSRKKKIIESRTKSTALLKHSLETTPHRVHTILAASAIGYYGDRQKELLSEDSGPGKGFLSECCIQWEAALHTLFSPHRRLVILRTGIVLDDEAGALKEMMKTLPFGIAPVFGNGKQIYSWIHLDDMCLMYMHALSNHIIKGIYNAVAPVPVTQRYMMKMIRKTKKTLSLMLPVPSISLRILLGELSSVVLISQNVSCDKFSAAGFKFKFDHIDAALQDIFKHTGN